MSKVNYFLQTIRRKRFLSVAYIILTALTMMFVVQGQLKRDTMGANNINEPNVSQSLYLSSVQVKYPDKSKETIFAGLKLCKLMKKMKTPDKVSFFTWVRYYQVFEKGSMTEIPFRATDGNYWDMMKFFFVEGRPYTEKEVMEKKPVIVISETSRKRFFGDKKQVVGQSIDIEGLHLIVCGVVKNVPYSSTYAFGEFWMPYTVWGGKIHGGSSPVDENAVQSLYLVQLLAHKKSDFPKIHQEYTSLLNELNKEIAPKLQISKAYLSTRVNYFFGKNNNSEKYELSFADISRNYLSTFWLLLVPLLALICLNFARANERSSEIAVRRIVGAGKSEISGELIIENAFVILIGIIIGTTLGYISVYLYPVIFISGADASNFQGGVWLPFTWNMFSHLSFAFLIFLVASVVLPIVRINHQSILKLLKGDEL